MRLAAPSWLKIRSLTSLMFAAVREVLGLPLPHFRAIVHCSYKCFVKSFKVIFFPSFCLKFFHYSLCFITFELIETFLLKYGSLCTHRCCILLFACKKTKLVPSFIKTRQLLTRRLKTLHLNQTLLILGHILCSCLKI